MFSIVRTVPSSDLDPIYQHLHHARVLLLLEEARLAFMAAIGFSNESFIERGIYPVIVNINIRYRREITAGEVRITCEECRSEKLLLKIRQRIFFKGNGRAAIEAEVDSALMDSKERRAVAPDEGFVEAFQSKFN